MHPLNRALRTFGFTINRVEDPLAGAKGVLFRRQLDAARNNERGWPVSGVAFLDESGAHPERSESFQCAFASRQLAALKPRSILDVGSIRYWLIGILAHSQVTTLDVRERRPLTANETVVTCDARALDFPDASFDMVVSLFTLAHIGLGRYGDPFDLDGDVRALAEMKRVLAPGGHLIVTLPFTLSPSFIYFNVRRYYDADSIAAMTRDMTLIDEEHYSHARNACCPPAEFPARTGMPVEQQYNMYFGCWRKS
jgi:SAM-dependent methyltransferase